jgi:hypothetical protein
MHELASRGIEVRYGTSDDLLRSDTAFQAALVCPWPWHGNGNWYCSGGYMETNP